MFKNENKVSHKDKNVVDDVIDLMEKHFGKLSVSRGEDHTFLGMNIRIRKDKKIEIENIMLQIPVHISVFRIKRNQKLAKNLSKERKIKDYIPSIEIGC